MLKIFKMSLRLLSECVIQLKYLLHLPAAKHGCLNDFTPYSCEDPETYVKHSPTPASDAHVLAYTATED